MDEEDLEMLFAPRCAQCGSIAQVMVRYQTPFEHDIWLCPDHLQPGDVIVEDYRECFPQPGSKD